MVHDDRVEWTILGAETTVHADIHVNVELGRLRNRSTCVGVIRADDPDALRWTNFCTDPARGAALFPCSIRLFIIHQERDIAHFLRWDQSFLRILDREDAF